MVALLGKEHDRYASSERERERERESLQMKRSKCYYSEWGAPTIIRPLIKTFSSLPREHTSSIFHVNSPILTDSLLLFY
jgi:hypothetical protein